MSSVLGYPFIKLFIFLNLFFGTLFFMSISHPTPYFLSIVLFLYVIPSPQMFFHLLALSNFSTLSFTSYSWLSLFRSPPSIMTNFPLYWL